MGQMQDCIGIRVERAIRTSYFRNTCKLSSYKTLELKASFLKDCTHAVKPVVASDDNDRRTDCAPIFYNT